MIVKNAMAAAGILVLLGATAACGSNSSSTASDAAAPTVASAAPSTATSDGFCQTLISLGAETTPADGAKKLMTVGTPSDASTSERHGYEVFVDHVSKLPDDATTTDFQKMETGLSKADQTDVQAFVTYVGKECQSALAASPSPSTK